MTDAVEKGRSAIGRRVGEAIDGGRVTLFGLLAAARWRDGHGPDRDSNVSRSGSADAAGCGAPDAAGPKRTFPSPQLSGYANIIQPARKTKRRMEMSKRFDGSTVSSLICGEV
jgi:hypothetical protein